jgi:hypothetical protein
MASAVERLPESSAMYVSSVCVLAKDIHQLLAMRAAIGGAWKKDVYDSTFALNNGEISIIADRDQVCRKVTREVAVPARPEIVLPAEPKRVETVTEWECPESLMEAASESPRRVSIPLTDAKRGA